MPTELGLVPTTMFKCPSHPFTFPAQSSLGGELPPPPPLPLPSSARAFSPLPSPTPLLLSSPSLPPYHGNTQLLRFAQNDVANAFSTSVNSGVYTMAQVGVVAMTMEFLGAVTAGGQVSSTIQKGVLSASLFKGKEGLLMLGMVCALMASSTWLQLANFMSWPVSTTHSIVGAVMGIGVAAFGGEGVEFGFCVKGLSTTKSCSTKGFTPISGEPLDQIPGNGWGPIAISWVFSPIAAGVLAGTMYLITRFLMLDDNVFSKLIYGKGDEAENSFFRSLILAPLIYGFVAGVLVVLLAFKGVASSSNANALALIASDKNQLALAAGLTSLVVLILAYVYVSWWQYRKNWTGEDLKWYEWSYHFLVPKRAVRAGFDAAHLTLRDLNNVLEAKDTATVVEAVFDSELSPNLDLEAAAAIDAKRKEVPEAIVAAQQVEGWKVVRIGEGEAVRTKMWKDIKEGVPPFACLPKGIVSSFINVLLAPFRFFLPQGVFTADGKERAVRDYNASNTDIATLHHAAKKYSDRTELVFKQLQIMTSCIASFSHGANDVANAMGPLSTVLGVYNCRNVKDAKGSGFTCIVDNGTSKPFSAENGWETPTWLLAVGGIMIGIGFTSYGYNLMRSLGNNLTYHSPSRAYCMELGAAIIVLIASRVGLPISTTQCITGATMAVGLLNGVRGVNWRRFAEIFFAWMITMPLVGIWSGLIFLFMASNPNFRAPSASFA